ncbi:MAG: deoxyribodipyrimidine photo-lyase [Crenarchaeota archaeon]|nr:MAG: deoxyribodipyrimidine photo-lyase [Thermoproteota archaeon]RDJ33932.1 MAG: deoxyribodipyrimidine photo-lyase [Thermoproteota archaeon]RDJ36956.1 MAG: deoxyribodipyrimidine photo-lyase [Thermoproteota archaeon]RDJ37509.1 MAG: deoxyribodipyrimidine photo-lyase [Thermoproteota archaeon]
MKNFKKTLFLFRRDLRLDDNTALLAACKESDSVLPCFIFDTKILKNFKKSRFRLRFLIESLIDLDAQLKKKRTQLHIFEGTYPQIIQKLLKENDIDAVFVNSDYTKSSKKRDSIVNGICKKTNVKFNSLADLTIQNFEHIRTAQGTPYKVFTQFFRKANLLQVRKPQKFTHKNFISKKSELSLEEISQKHPKTDSPIKGGTYEGRKILKNMSKFKNYGKDRNYPYLDATTHLSAHNKFGTISIREIYHKIADELGKDHTLISELFWRDFFISIMYYYPYTFGSSFRKKYSKIPWSTNKKSFEKWANGMTGFPIVDAGMRELNATGYMHNRVRMIVASFLTKDLHINWKWGERYFAEKLIDYDPSVNVGNWQWAASTGCDSQPWFRIFNPWMQQKKFDPDCKYIKKWIPELEDISEKDIHNWDKSEIKNSYPLPMLDHREESEHTKQVFKKLSN